jgi:hypothetical protein
MLPRTQREYLRELVADKNRGSRRLADEERALGFLGWHERGYLPHCDFPGSFSSLRSAFSIRCLLHAALCRKLGFQQRKIPG